MYDQLRLQSTSVSSYDDLGRSVTGVSDLYYVSDAQTTNQAIGYTRCCKPWTVEQTSAPFFYDNRRNKAPIVVTWAKAPINPFGFLKSRYLAFDIQQ